MKTKFLYILSFVIASCSFVGCNDLDEELYSTYDKDNFYQNETQMEMATNGLYQVFTGNTWFVSLRYLSTSPYKYTRVAGSTLSDYCRYNFNYTDTYCEYMWTLFYRAINRANALLAAAPDCVFTDEEVESGAAEEAINRCMGEAKFFRGWCYFNLAVYYGRVPLQIEETTSIDGCNLPRCNDIRDVYEVVIADLESAIELLPLENPTTGRVSRAAAIAMLGKVYLQMAGMPLQDADAYQKCIDTVSELGDSIVAGDGAFGAALLDDVVEVFSVYNKCNDEMLFTIPAGGEGDCLNGISTAFAPTGQPGTFLTVDGDTIIAYTDSPTVHSISFSEDLYNLYNVEDVRRNKLWAYEYWCTKYGDVSYSSNAVYKARGISILKYKDPDMTVNLAGTTDIPVLRSVEVLLMLAEANNELQKVGTAVDYLNVVRARSSAPEYVLGTDYYGPDDLRTLIHRERDLELVGEFGEIFDIRRQGAVQDHMEDHRDPYAQAEDVSYSMKYELSPIPYEEISRNSAISSSDQNSGW